MIITYRRGDGGEVSTHDYKPDLVLSAEAEAVETATGLTFDEINVQLLKGGMKARRAILWMLLKRENPPLKYASVSFAAGDVTVEWDADERAEMRKALARAEGLSDEDREALENLLGDDEGAAPDDEAEPAGKAGETSDSGT